MGWISVKKRLPEVGHWYVVYTKKYEFETMAFLDSIVDDVPLWLAHNDHEADWIEDDWENVTHWLEIEPPTDSED